MKKLKKLMRSGGRLTRIKKPWGTREGNLTGVCEGLGTYLGIRPFFLRIAFGIALVSFPFFTLLVYLALAALMPDQRGFSFVQDTDWKQLGEMLGAKNSPQQGRGKAELSLVVCSYCDTAVREDAKYCPKCGNKL
ncbi:MAG: PspC domain-containing protein [Bacteroidetes bacterium]|nr:MAG: PspC domain-containing protein [Bacteroidota bacterium]